MRHLTSPFFSCLMLAALFILQACASSNTNLSEAQAISHKQRWYWLGSTSLQDHYSPRSPKDFWIEINDEDVILQADCNHASAKATTTKEVRLWIKGIATTRTVCPNGRMESIFLHQVARVNFTEQRANVLRINLEQYGEAMFFSLDPKAEFNSYRCTGGESMARIKHKKWTSFWKGDQYHESRPLASSDKSQQENSDEKFHLNDNCQKIISEDNK